jgi:Domain of unknown function (DUF222)
MALGTELTDWRQVTIPRVAFADWTVDDAKEALVEIKRIGGLLDAAQAVFVGVVANQLGRDTKAALARHLKMSSAEASKAVAVADVVKRVPDAEEALADGRMTADQLHKLAAVQDDKAAAELLRAGAENNDSPEEFSRRVQKHRIDSEGPSLQDRQRASRGVWFTSANDGCVGLRAVLPPVEGAQLKAALDEFADQQYRAKHPERAREAGGHNEEPRSRRLADALVELVLGLGVNDSKAVDSNESPSPAHRQRNGRSGRTAVIVTIKAETLEAEILGTGPISTREALSLVGQAKVDLYAAITSVKGQILNFGRSRRLASPLQHLALAVRDGGYCVQPGCSVPWNQCDADHVQAWESGGTSDLTNFRHLCTNLHHPHRHETDQPESSGPEPDPKRMNERINSSFERAWKQVASPPEAA